MFRTAKRTFFDWVLNILTQPIHLIETYMFNDSQQILKLYSTLNRNIWKSF